MDPTRGHHRACPPTRATARFTLAFGHLAVAVAAFPATAPNNTLRRREFTVDGQPVGRLHVNKADNTFLDPGLVLKRATASDGTTVGLSDDELAAIVPLFNEPVPVEWLVPQRVLWDGTYVVHSTYHLRQRGADRRERVNTRQDALSAVLEALRQESAAAVLRAVIAGRAPRWCALLPDGRLLALRFAEEARPLPAPPGAPSGRAVADARRAARGIGTGIPVLTDDAGARVRQYVDDKAREVLRPEIVTGPFTSMTDFGQRLDAGAPPARTRRRSRRGRQDR